MENQTVQQLRQMAKDLKIEKYKSLRKRELITQITERQKIPVFQFDEELFSHPKPLRQKPIFQFDKNIFSEHKKSRVKPAFNFSDAYFNETFPEKTKVQKPFTINIKNSKYIKKYNAYQISYEIRLVNQSHKNVQELIEHKTDVLRNALNTMVDVIKKRTKFRNGDKLNIGVQSPELNNPISTGHISNGHSRALLRRIQSILTSSENLDLSRLTFSAQMIGIPRGAGRSKIINLSTDLRTKKCITQIRNNDCLCAPRAIVTGLTYHTNVIFEKEFSMMEIKQIRMGRRLQKDLAIELCNQLGDYNEDGFTLEDIKNVENLLNIRIKIVCAENLNTIIYNGSKESNTVVYLYKNQNHFDVINSMKAFLGSVYYCEKCDKTYQNKNKHTCKNKRVCIMCKSEEHKNINTKIYCKGCNRYCYNQDCFDKHGEVCTEVCRCLYCSIIYKRSLGHTCGYKICRNCKQEVEINSHQCYMQWQRQKGGFCTRKRVKGCQQCMPDGCLIDGKKVNYHVQTCALCKRDLMITVGEKFKCVCVPNAKPIKNKCAYSENYIWFDYEARQETGIHIPNLIIAHDFGGKKYTFETNEEFCKWLISKEHKNYTCIAHNAKGYDSQFILKYCVENTIKPFTIYNGS